MDASWPRASTLNVNATARTKEECADNFPNSGAVVPKWQVRIIQMYSIVHQTCSRLEKGF